MSRPAHKSIKVKKELDQLIDCFLTGNFKPSTWAYKEIPTWTYWFDIKNQEKLNGKLYLDYAARLSQSQKVLFMVGRVQLK